MKRCALLVLSGLCAGLLAACGSTINHQRVGMVKSAALAGFSAELNIEETSQRQSGSITGTIGAFQEMKQLGSEETEMQRREQGEKTYDSLAARLQEGMGWTVKPREEVSGNEAYKQLFGTRIGGDATGLAARGKRIYTPGILWQERVRGLSPEERKQLFDSLGVDALAFAHVNFQIGDRKGVTVGGMGSMTVFPNAHVQLWVFTPDLPDAIWYDYAVGGPASTGITTTMGVEKNAELTAVLAEAAELGYATLLQRYQQDKERAAKEAAEAAAAQPAPAAAPAPAPAPEPAQEPAPASGV